MEITIPRVGVFKLSKLTTYYAEEESFQRLKNIKQLGRYGLVKTGSQCSRYEHSLDVAYFAGRQIRHLLSNSEGIIISLSKLFSVSKGNFKYISERVPELVETAGLLHDFCHGPYSHDFDRFLIMQGNKFGHESRISIYLPSYLKSSGLLSDAEIDFIVSLINPGENDVHPVFGIINNKLSFIDVDKIAYINRDAYDLGEITLINPLLLIDTVEVVNGCLAYPKQMAPEIANVFNARHFLHENHYKCNNNISLLVSSVLLMTILEKQYNLTTDFVLKKPADWSTDSHIVTIAAAYVRKLCNSDKSEDRSDDSNKNNDDLINTIIGLSGSNSFTVTEIVLDSNAKTIELGEIVVLNNKVELTLKISAGADKTMSRVPFYKIASGEKALINNKERKRFLIKKDVIKRFSLIPNWTSSELRID